ncbi:hypothetical protein VNO77_03728 [Canavalia gladiata]|uniref:Uncharacterized protein n=1 Tax=Canavalia gladiata TaxID=3824 RepID=A0AAN9N0E1_CANGL
MMNMIVPRLGMLATVPCTLHRVWRKLPNVVRLSPSLIHTPEVEFMIIARDNLDNASGIRDPVYNPSYLGKITGCTSKYSD